MHAQHGGACVDRQQARGERPRRPFVHGAAQEGAEHALARHADDDRPADRGQRSQRAQERESGQRFIVDLEMTLIETSATRTDHLADTVDYEAIAEAVAAIVEGPPVSLLEHLAALVADRVMAEPRVLEVAVTLRKPEVRLARPVAETAVTLRRAR